MEQDINVKNAAKESIRSELRLRRKASVNAPGSLELNHQLIEQTQKLLQILSQESSQSEFVIASYVAFGSETDVHELRALAGESFRWVYPKVLDHGLEFYFADKEEDFEKSSWGVMEPKSSCPQVELAHIDFMLIPGLGFSRSGYRMGQGQGHYDRVLSQMEALKIGVSLSSQIIEEDHFFEPHDVAMDFVVTEKYILQVKKKGELWTL